MTKHSPRRSLLFVPGTSEKMINKALELQADSIILDLEDAVSMSEKSIARKLVKDNIYKFKEKNIEVIVRLNDITSELGVLDMEAIVEELPNAVIVPKADEDAILTAEILLKSTELRYGINKNSIEIIPLLETSYSIANAYKILTVSRRITAVQLGAEDLTNELGIKRTIQGKEIEYARSVIAHAGNACKIDIIDTPFTHIKDDESLKRDTMNSKGLGFTGKACIHPRQLSIINEIYTPDFKEVEKANELLQVFENASNNGKGVCTFEGNMIDKPVADRARKLVDKANAILKFKNKR